jgi:hypothetical protein
LSNIKNSVLPSAGNQDKVVYMVLFHGILFASLSSYPYSAVLSDRNNEKLLYLIVAIAQKAAGASCYGGIIKSRRAGIVEHYFPIVKIAIQQSSTERFINICRFTFTVFD